MAAFVDTNILIYAFADTSGGSLDKVAIARSLVASLFEQNELILSAQVLSEFSVTALSKVKPPLTIGQINERVLELSTQTVVPIDASLVQLALQRSETSRISYWDALIVEAAIRSGANVLYTEDMHHGTRYGELLPPEPVRALTPVMPSDTPQSRRTDTALIQIVTAALASATLRSGHHLVCRPGCSQCCIGVFPIAQQDAARLRDGLAALAHTDPQRAARIRTRTAEALTRLDPWFPGDIATGVLGDSYEDAILFEEFANNEPCPALDRETGTCDLYEHRPVLCRTFGPPMRTEEGNLATCELCYITASTEEIAQCELDPEVPALEAASNAAYNKAAGRHGETLIAYALRGC